MLGEDKIRGLLSEIWEERIGRWIVLSLQGFGEYGELGIGFFFGLFDEPFHFGQGGFEVVAYRTCLDDRGSDGVRFGHAG